MKGTDNSTGRLSKKKKRKQRRNRESAGTRRPGVGKRAVRSRESFLRVEKSGSTKKKGKEVRRGKKGRGEVEKWAALSIRRLGRAARMVIDEEKETGSGSGEGERGKRGLKKGKGGRSLCGELWKWGIYPCFAEKKGRFLESGGRKSAFEKRNDCNRWDACIGSTKEGNMCSHSPQGKGGKDLGKNRPGREGGNEKKPLHGRSVMANVPIQGRIVCCLF